MRHRLPFLVLAVGLVVGLLAGPALADRDAARQAGQVRRQLAPQAHAALTNPSNDITRTLVVNHGTAAAGQAVIQGWNRQTYDDQGLPAAVTAFGQAARLHNVKRIAISVVLRTAGGTTDDTAIGPWRNSGNIGNPRIFQANSPSIGAGFYPNQPIPQFCESWWEVRYQIRWADDAFTQGSLLAYADLWNDNCYFIQAP
jgi:hypothetical protein